MTKMVLRNSACGAKIAKPVCWLNDAKQSFEALVGGIISIASTNYGWPC
jgi:hypothetical protein